MGSQFIAEYMRLLDQGMYNEAFVCARKEDEKVSDNWWGNACKVLKQYAIFNAEYADTKFMRSSTQVNSGVQIQATQTQQQQQHFSPPIQGGGGGSGSGGISGTSSLRGITVSAPTGNSSSYSTTPGGGPGGSTNGTSGFGSGSMSGSGSVGNGGTTTSYFVPHNDLRNGIIQYTKTAIPLLSSYESQMSLFISLGKNGPDHLEASDGETEGDEITAQTMRSQVGPLTPVLPRLSSVKTQKQRPGSLLVSKRYPQGQPSHRSALIKEGTIITDPLTQESPEKKDEFKPQDFIRELSYIFFAQAQMIKAYKLISERRIENDMMSTVALGVGYCVGFIERNVKKIISSKFVNGVIYEGKVINHAVAAHLAIAAFKVLPSLISIFTCKKLLKEWHERCCNETIITVHPPFTPRSSLTNSSAGSPYRSFDGKSKSFIKASFGDDETNEKTWYGNRLYTFLDAWVKFLSVKASYYFFYVPKTETTEMEQAKSSDDALQRRMFSSSRGSDKLLALQDVGSAPSQDTPDAIIRKLFEDFVIEIPYVLSVGLLLDMKNGPYFDVEGYKCEDPAVSGLNSFGRGRAELSEFRSWVPLYCTQSPPMTTKKTKISKFSFARTKQLQEEAGKVKLVSEKDGPKTTMLCAIGDIASIVRESGDGALRQELISCTGKVYTLALIKVSPIESVYLVSLFPRGMFNFRDKSKDMEVIKDFFAKVSGFFQMNEVISIIEPSGKRNSQKNTY